MTDIEARLDTYADLSLAQRDEVDAYVRSHPEWRGQLAEAKAFTALLEAAGEESAADQAARRAVDEWMGLRAQDADEIPHDPGGAVEIDRITARLEALAEAGEDPVRRFERLTGRRVPPPPRAAASNGRAVGLLSVPAPDRAAASHRRRRRLPRWIATAVALVAVAWGGLYAVSALTISERAQVAALAELSSYDAPVLRGTAPDALSDRLDVALGRLDGARRSTLGLFPTYDPDALDSVVEELGAIAAEAEAETSVSQEARLALGRVYLSVGRDADAARVLGTLVREGSYRGPEARRLLDYIRAQDDV